MTEIERLLDEEGAEAESNPDAPLRRDTKLTRGHARTRTLQVRLNEEEDAAITALAEARNLPVSTLVRHLLLQQAQPGVDGPSALIESIRRELDLLSQQIS